MANMRNKAALVTGAAHGIGRASAIALARVGASVCVADIDDAAGAAVVDEIVAAGGQAFYQHCDVRSVDDASAMVGATMSRFGRLDAAVNNAGIAGSFDHRLHEADDDMLDLVLAVNLRGVWNCLKAELDVMLSQGGGAIVNMASVAGLIGAPKAAAYTASKHAVVGITKSAALDYARSGIRVNAVCPAYTDTRMAQMAVAADPRMQSIMERAIPMGRLGTADEIANAAAWLCSDESSFVTGHALVLDGGLVAI